jgi:hypothetical protein
METTPAIAFRMVTKYRFHDSIGVGRERNILFPPRRR